MILFRYITTHTFSYFGQSLNRVWQNQRFISKEGGILRYA